MKSVKDLKVYKMAFKISLDIYKLTEKILRCEQFGLVSQMRRAVVSFCSNLVEGASRGTTKEYLHFAHVAKGSVSELGCRINLSVALGFINEPFAKKLKNDINEILRLLSGLVNTLTLATNTNH